MEIRTYRQQTDSVPPTPSNTLQILPDALPSPSLRSVRRYQHTVHKLATRYLGSRKCMIIRSQRHHDNQCPYMKGGWFIRLRFFPLDPLLYQQAGLMKLVLCIFFLALLVDSCRGLNFTVPAKATQRNTITFRWNATLSDFKMIITNASFVALLIKPPGNGYHCPKSNIITELKAIAKDGNVTNVIEDSSPTSQSDRRNNSGSGSVLLLPIHSQEHFVCAYG
ncbi:hypothetical protein PQX77_018006 [Marasmius sp. AFHP31]|nr:hypothetical protein PQX77_018006 [Marasmius sp. AFHP31]